MFGQKKKLEGFIIRRSDYPRIQEPSRTLSEEYPNPTIPTQSLIHPSTHDHPNPPSPIKPARSSPSPLKHTISISTIDKKDEQMNYNADIYHKQKHKEIIIYEQHKEDFLATKKQVKKQEKQVIKQIKRQTQRGQSPNKLDNRPQINNNLIVKSKEELSKIEEFQYQNQPEILKINHLHGQFSLQRFVQVHKFLNKIIQQINLHQIDLLSSIQNYIFFTQKYNFNQTKDLKMFQDRKIVIKNSLSLEKKSIIAVCFSLAINKFSEFKNYCSNVLKYCVQNNLVILNLLTYENNGRIIQIIKKEKEYLLGKGIQFLRENNEIISQLIIKIFKQDSLFSDQFFNICEKKQNQSLQVQIYHIKTFFAFYLNAIKQDRKISFFAMAPKPFILEEPSHEYTLVIDFISIFMNHNNSITIKQQLKRQNLTLRPYSQYFLKELSQYFQIISFSDLMPIQCKKLFQKMDEKDIIKHKLYKYHIDNQSKQKDVRLIGRNLDKVILLDSLQDKGNDNVIMVNKWKGESNDAILAEICPVLAHIALKRLSTLDSIRKIKESIAKSSGLGLKYLTYDLNL